MQQDKQRIKSFNLKALKSEEFKSVRKIQTLKLKLQQSFGLVQQYEYYITIPKRYINMFLYCIFGQSNILNKQQLKNPLNKLDKNQQKDINVLMNSGKFTNKGPQIQKYKISISKLQRLGNQFKNHLLIFQKASNLWNQIAPKQLPQRYKKTYFKIQDIDQNWNPLNQSQNLDNLNKQSLVIPIQQDNQVTILCFYTLSNAINYKQINRIIDPIISKTYKIEKPKVKQPVKQKDQKIKKQSKIYQQQQMAHQQNQPQQIDQQQKEQNQIPQFSKDKLSIFWLFLMILLIPLIVDSLGTGYAKLDRNIQNLNIMQKHLVQGKQKFDQIVVKPINQTLLLWKQQLFCSYCPNQ